MMPDPETTTSRARRLRLLVGLAVTLALALLGRQWWAWQQERLAETRSVAQRLNQGEVILERRAEVGERLATVRGRIADLRQHYFDGDTAQTLQLRVQKRLEKLAGANNLTIQRSSWETVDAEATPHRLPFQLRLVGTNVDLQALIAQLERESVFYALDRITLRAHRSGPGRVQARIELSVYLTTGSPAGEADTGPSQNAPDPEET
jgi:HAMP domain-containing protein